MEKKNENTTDIEVAGGKTIDVWRDEKLIREQFAPNLTPVEFKFFCGMGASLGANPFIREIWAVKYSEHKPAAIFLGRDFFRRKAQEQEDYNGHVVEAVYSNDDCIIEDGIVSHNWRPVDRGSLVGAYCRVHRRGIDKPFFVYCELSEYDKEVKTGDKKNLWNTMKSTMIKKVAEAQAIRMAYQGLFKGSYSEAEQNVIEITAEDEKNDKTTTQQEHPDPQAIHEKPNSAVWSKLAEAMGAAGRDVFEKAKAECLISEPVTVKEAQNLLAAIDKIANE